LLWLLVLQQMLRWALLRELWQVAAILQRRLDPSPSRVGLVEGVEEPRRSEADSRIDHARELHRAVRVRHVPSRGLQLLPHMVSVCAAALHLGEDERRRQRPPRELHHDRVRGQLRETGDDAGEAGGAQLVTGLPAAKLPD